MNMKKILCLVLALMMTVCCLASCGAKSDDELVMATNAAFPPYEYMEGEEYAGIDIDLAEAIAEKLGKKLVIENVEFGTIVTGVETGKYDVGIAGMTVTDERKEQVDFSIEYVTSTQYIIVPADVDPATFDLNDKIIGVQQGTTGDMFYASVTDVFTAKEVKRYKSAVDAAADMELGRVDCVIIDELPAKKIVENNSDSMICYDAGWAPEDYAIAVQKGSDLLPVINKVLERLVSEGKIDEYLINHTAA